MNAKVPRPLEKDIQRGIARGLRVLGFKVFRRNVGGLYDKAGNYVAFAEKGQSDLYGWIIATGIHFEFETKRSGEEPTPKQLGWLKACASDGIPAWWSDNIKDAMRVAEAVIQGGRIIWDEGCEFHVEIP